MAINEQEIQNIVRSVLQGMNVAPKTESSPAPATGLLASYKGSALPPTRIKTEKEQLRCSFSVLIRARGLEPPPSCPD